MLVAEKKYSFQRSRARARKKIMARLSRGEFFCDVCNEAFHYESRLERHRNSSSHKDFVAAIERQRISLIQTQQTSVAEDEYNDVDFVQEDDDSDACAEDNFEDLLKQFREREKMGYHPFPSKIFALLYILIHGPHPIGNTALMFIWFILQECGIKVPSLSTVKSFKPSEVLMPQRNESTDGTPYYSLTLTSIIRTFLQNPQMSNSLARFPVRTEGNYTLRNVFATYTYLTGVIFLIQ